MPDEKQLLDAHYIKNNDFRTVFSTGIIGGLLSSHNNHLININFITDRAPIPNKITFEIDRSSQQIGREFDKEARSGVIREVHFGVMMDIQTATEVIEWLTKQVNAAKQQANGFHKEG